MENFYDRLKKLIDKCVHKQINNYLLFVTCYMLYENNN